MSIAGLSVRRSRRHIEINSVRMAFRPDRCFASVARFEGPEQRPAKCGAPDVYKAESDAQPIGFFTHRGETALV